MPLSLRPLAALLLAVAMTPAALSPVSAVAGPEVRAKVLSIGDGAGAFRLVSVSQLWGTSKYCHYRASAEKPQAHPLHTQINLKTSIHDCKA